MIQYGLLAIYANKFLSEPCGSKENNCIDCLLACLIAGEVLINSTYLSYTHVSEIKSKYNVAKHIEVYFTASGYPTNNLRICGCS